MAVELFNDHIPYIVVDNEGKLLCYNRGDSIEVFLIYNNSMLHWGEVDQAAPQQFP